jgi:hypothetical protein
MRYCLATTYWSSPRSEVRCVGVGAGGLIGSVTADLLGLVIETMANHSYAPSNPAYADLSPRPVTKASNPTGGVL